jgi:SAM-dependent methyltransferase
MLTFTDQRMFVTGVDSSPAMLAVAKRRSEKTQGSSTLIQEDIRNYIPTEKSFDLVWCIGDVLNYMSSIRDLDNLFQRVNWGLDKGKTFLFDLRTIQGLAQNLGKEAEIIHDSIKCFVTARSQFSYENSTLEREYVFFYQNEQAVWIQGRENHTLRGYPYRALVNLLNRVGFEVKDMVNLDLESYESHKDPYGRMVVIAEKIRDYDPSATKG